MQALEGAFGGKPEKTSAVLRSFALPMLAEAVAADEQKAADDEMLTAFETLKKRFIK